MGIRVRELWRTRKQRRAVENALLAEADQAERQEWVDRTREARIPGQWDGHWTAEMLDRLNRDLQEPGEYGDAS